MFAFFNSLKESGGDRDIENNIEVSLKQLGKADLSISSAGQSLQILPLGPMFSDTDIKELLDGQFGVSHPSSYSYGKNGPHTMSAQGVDQYHYLVHSFLEGYQPFEVDNVMLPLYALAKRKSYLLDEKQYSGRADVWQSSRQAFFNPKGDCEDHAIILADWLMAMGEDARVVLGDMDGGGHAWVVLFKNGKEYLLEATRKSGLGRTKPYPLAALYKDYHPRYMFNREGFWVNHGDKFTTDYSGKHWQEMSRYSVSTSVRK
ncbi:transglutaminase-like domain-containing protein [Porticoccaceae bacterium LTM1]|nr:transglutaminase-like domain-containing protein [Porticoccaceae bacterium LTM1]